MIHVTMPFARARAISRPTLLLLLPALAVCAGDAPVAEAEALTRGEVVNLETAQLEALGIETDSPPVETTRGTREVHAVVESPDTAAATVGSIVEGRVLRVSVLAGDRVRRDQLLLEIESHELADARAAASAARSELTVANAALERGRTLMDAGAISREEMDGRERDAAVAAAEAERAEEWLGHLNPTERGTVAVSAPVSGTVFDVHVGPGEAVVPGTPLVTVGAEGGLWIQAQVPEGIPVRVSEGESARVFLHAPIDLEVTARVIRQGGRIDPETRSVQLRLALDSVPEGLRPGTWATLHLPMGDPVTGRIVPRDAVVRSQVGDAVFVRESEGSFRRVPVTAEPVGAERMIVTGAPPDAELVVAGAYLLEAALRTGGEESGA